MSRYAFVAVAVFLSIVATLVAIADLRPPEYHDWCWNVDGSPEIHVGWYGVHWYTRDGLGMWDNEVYAMLRDNRAWSFEPEYDPAFTARVRELMKLDETKKWSWPKYGQTVNLFFYRINWGI